MPDSCRGLEGDDSSHPVTWHEGPKTWHTPKTWHSISSKAWWSLMRRHILRRDTLDRKWHMYRLRNTMINTNAVIHPHERTLVWWHTGQKIWRVYRLRNTMINTNASILPHLLYASRTRSFLEAGFRPLYPSFVWFVPLIRTKRGFWTRARTRPRIYQSGPSWLPGSTPAGFQEDSVTRHARRKTWHMYRLWIRMINANAAILPHRQPPFWGS